MCMVCMHYNTATVYHVYALCCGEPDIKTSSGFPTLQHAVTCLVCDALEHYSCIPMLSVCHVISCLGLRLILSALVQVCFRLELVATRIASPTVAAGFPVLLHGSLS